MVCCWITWNDRPSSRTALDFQDHSLCDEAALWCPRSFRRAWGRLWDGCKDRPGTGQGGGSQSGAIRRWSPKALGAPLCTRCVARALWALEEVASCRTSFSLWIQKIEGKGAWVFMHWVAVITDLDSWQRRMHWRSQGQMGRVSWCLPGIVSMHFPNINHQFVRLFFS